MQTINARRHAVGAYKPGQRVRELQKKHIYTHNKGGKFFAGKQARVHA